MLLPLVLLAAAAAASAAAQSSASAARETTQFVTTTVSAQMSAATGVNTMQTGDVASRVKLLQGLEYASLQALAHTSFEVPSGEKYLVEGTPNAIQFEGIVPRKRPLAIMLGRPQSPPNNGTIARQLNVLPLELDTAYAGANSTVFKCPDEACTPRTGYFIAAIDTDCFKNTSVPIQGCIWAVSEHFEYKPPGTPLSLAVPARPGSGATARHASLTVIALGAVAVSVLVL